MSDEGQKQTLDLNPVIPSLSAENLEIATRKGWVKDGKFSQDFNLNTAFDSYRGIEKLQGQKTLIAPKLDDDAAFDQWEGHALLGVPEKPDGYKFDKPRLPEGMEWGKDGLQWDDKSEKEFREAAAKAKIGSKQAGRLFNELAASRMGQLLGMRDAIRQDKAAMEANLDRDWGAGKAGQVAAAGQAWKFVAKQAGLDENRVVDTMASILGNETAVRLFAGMARMLGEDSLKGGQGAGFATGPEAAKRQIDDFKADKAKIAALHNKTDPLHKKSKEEWDRLWALAEPGK